MAKDATDNLVEVTSRPGGSWAIKVSLTAVLAVVGSGLAFWRSTETKLAVHEARIAALEKQVDKLGDDMDDLARIVW